MSLRVDRAGAAAVLTIDRPRAKNALDRATARRIGGALREQAADEAVRAIVLTGSGVLTAAGDAAFVSGGDLREFAALAAAPSGADEVLAMYEDLVACVEVDVPVIAAVNGAAIGGGAELTLLCDLVVMEEHASIAFRQAAVGLSSAWGGAARLAHRVGPLEAARLLYTCARVSAEEARALGLVSEVVAAGRSREAAVALAERIAKQPRAAIAAAKATLRAVQGASRSPAEVAAFKALWGGPDHLAAMSAFLGR